MNDKVAAIRIAHLPIGELRLHPRNPREHPKPGSPVWEIGSHRLLCGDCASHDNWQRLLQGGLADMMAIDPPYNVAYDQNQRKRDKAQGDATAKPITILNDDLPHAEYRRLLSSWLGTASAMLKPGAAIYIAHADSFGLETRSAAAEAGFKIAQCLIWVKQAWTLGRQDYQWQHEPILYGWKTGGGHYWQGGYSNSTIIDDEPDLKKLTKGELITRLNHLRNAEDTTIIREPRPTILDLHPTMKPVRLMARFIHNSSRRGETVLELFSGSGTTLMASEQLGRRCVATELDPKFCAVTLERATASGLEAAKLNGTN